MYMTAVRKFFFLITTDGTPGGLCSASLQCTDTDSTCSNGVCQCNLQYTNILGTCTKGIYVMFLLYH